MNLPIPAVEVAPSRRQQQVLGVAIDVLDWQQIIERIDLWTQHRESRYVCLCNVHSVVTARRSAAFLRAINDADAVAPDGMPVVWRLRKQGFANQERISGPDLMWKYAEHAAQTGVPIYLYGGTAHALTQLQLRLRATFPKIQLVGSYSPPFRELTADEQQAINQEIIVSGARVVFVALGCPKQELWMARQRGKLPLVMIGVGAAFEFHAGLISRAPRWMRDHGLEWLHRLASEPRRLWRRYLVTNALFAYYLMRERITL